MMNKIFANPYFILISRLVVGFIFITYGTGKIVSPDKFASEIANYALFPEFSLNIIALILPWIELVVGLLLILGLRIKSGSAISGVLMLLFILAIIWAMALGLDINCGCSSSSPQKVGLPKLLENLGLLALSALIYMFPNRKFTLESFSDK
jgi:putative oxidoreductase